MKIAIPSHTITKQNEYDEKIRSTDLTGRHNRK